MNYVKGIDRTQIQFECLNDYIDDESDVLVIDKLVDLMDLVSMGFIVGNNEESGRARFDCKDLLKLYIYGYSNGIRSSRKLQKQTLINREIIWLLKGVQPKYRAIADFRKENIEPLKKVFEVFTDFCNELGLYGKELIAVDGTKIEANASRKKHYSKSKLKVMKEKVRERVQQYINELEKNDSIEESNENEVNKDKLKAAINALEDKIKNYENIEKTLDEKGVSEINLTDPDARTMNFNNYGKDLAYNVQTVVDSKNKLIVTFNVTNQVNDLGEIYNMSKKAMDKLGVETIEALADKGYFNIDELEKCKQSGITTYVARQKENNSTGNQDYVLSKFIYDKNEDLFICPEGQKLYCHTQKQDASEKSYYNYGICEGCINRDKCTTSKNGRKLCVKKNYEVGREVLTRTEANYEKYKTRQMIIEHPFGTIKRVFNMDYFLLRNLAPVGGEVSVAFFAYNLKRVIKILGINQLINKIVTKKVIRYGI